MFRYIADQTGYLQNGQRLFRSASPEVQTMNYLEHYVYLSGVSLSVVSHYPARMRKG